MKTRQILSIFSIIILATVVSAKDEAKKDPNAYEKGSVAASLRQSLEAAGVSKGAAVKTESQPAVATTQTVVVERASATNATKVVHKAKTVVVQQPVVERVVVREVAAPVERNFTVMAGGSSHGSSRHSGLNLGGLIRIGADACGYSPGTFGTWGMSPGEQAAYEDGLAREEARIQRERERAAYNAGRTAARRGW